MDPSQGYIRYNKATSEREYAALCFFQEADGLKFTQEVWLGRVIDKEKNIFFNKKDGFITLSSEYEKIKLSDSEITTLKLVKKRKKSTKNITQYPRIINFGDIFIFYEFIKQSGLLAFFENIFPNDSQSLQALILFKLLEKEPFSQALDWWSDSYARYLFPEARLESSRIHEILEVLGTEEGHRNFFLKYLEFLQPPAGTVAKLIYKKYLPRAGAEPAGSAESDLIQRYLPVSSQDWDFNEDIYILPLHPRGQEIMSGNILLSFMVFICSSKISPLFKEMGFTIHSCIKQLQNLHAHVLKNKIIPDNITNSIYDITRTLAVRIPAKIKID
ncbi:MAG: hypothetical protein LBK52_05270 [Deltaproteobacteria bacterium]|jgi:hypothetical protein|nr:hypothetical protein [Deltaproteobacteria bacterium]